MFVCGSAGSTCICAEHAHLCRKQCIAVHGAECNSCPTCCPQGSLRQFDAKRCDEQLGQLVPTIVARKTQKDGAHVLAALADVGAAFLFQEKYADLLALP